MLDMLYCVFVFRMEGGIPPLVELLHYSDTKVQRAAAGALRTLAFKNDENKNQVSFCWICVRKEQREHAYSSMCR